MPWLWTLSKWPLKRLWRACRIRQKRKPSQRAKNNDSLSTPVAPQPAIKLEAGVKLEPGVKEEPGIKVEQCTGIKRERAEEEDEDVESTLRRRVRIKTEPGSSSSSSGKGLVFPKGPTTPETRPGHLPRFRERLPGWIKDCLEFQKAKRTTYAPTRPCCPANCFLDDVGPPPKPPPGGKYTSCWHRLTPEQQLDFTHYYNQHKDNLYCSFLFAEKEEPVAAQPRKAPVPPAQRQRGPALPKSHAWMIHKDGELKKPLELHAFESIGTGPPEESASSSSSAPAFESAGTGPPEESASSSSSAPANAPFVAQGKSGVARITWHSSPKSWRIEPRASDFKKFDHKSFWVAHYPGDTFEERSQNALQAAMIAKADLVSRGFLADLGRSVSLDKQSGEARITWKSAVKGWYIEKRTSDDQSRMASVSFPVSRYCDDAEIALDAAIEVKRQLIADGIIKTPQARFERAAADMRRR